VPCARLRARQLVWEWGLNDLANSIELCVSELVTNAVKAMTPHHDLVALGLRLSGDNARVLIEVWDADPRPPALKDPSEDGIPDLEEEGGRGLVLVAALSTRWDWYLTQNPPGKVIWCELKADLPEPAQYAPQPLLPRRVPHPQQKQPVEVMNDLELLRRVRDRLRDPDRSNLPMWPNSPTI
jgi:anti-sigma regulatory factor (Ser/Thr protein kinase)